MTSLRRHSRSFAGLAASLFLAVWVSMALAPCLMAAEAIIGSDCPHCPEPLPCHDPGEVGACTYVDGYDFDGRAPVAPKVDVELVLAPPLELMAVALPVQRRNTASWTARAPPDPVGPRLHLRHCVLRN